MTEHLSTCPARNDGECHCGAASTRTEADVRNARAIKVIPDRVSCYKCKFRRDVGGSHHSSCAYPSSFSAEHDLAAGMLGLSLVRASKVIQHGTLSATLAILPGFELGADPYGVRAGWFMWPLDFDPVWLKSCTAFAPKDEAQDHTEVARDLCLALNTPSQQ